MITDEDLVPFEFADFFDDEDSDNAPSSQTIDSNYIDYHIARIPQHGDESRWRLADYLNMFEHLAPDGSLTDEQRQAVDYFAIGWKSDRTNSLTYSHEGKTDA